MQLLFRLLDNLVLGISFSEMNQKRTTTQCKNNWKGSISKSWLGPLSEALRSAPECLSPNQNLLMWDCIHSHLDLGVRCDKALVGRLNFSTFTFANNLVRRYCKLETWLEGVIYATELRYWLYFTRTTWQHACKCQGNTHRTCLHSCPSIYSPFPWKSETYTYFQTWYRNSGLYEQAITRNFMAIGKRVPIIIRNLTHIYHSNQA